MAFGKKNQKQYRAPTSEPDGVVVGVIIAYKALPKWSRQLMSFAGCIAGMTAFGLVVLSQFVMGRTRRESAI